MRHQTARRQELEADYQRLHKQQAELAARVHEVSGEFEQTVGDLEKYSDEFAHRRAALEGAEATVRELADRVSVLRSTLERDRHELLESVRGLSTYGSRATTLEAQLSVLSDAREAATERLSDVERKIAACRDQCAAQAKLVEAAAAQQQALREELQSVQGRRAALVDEQADAQQRLSELREQRGAVHARRGLLEEFERRQEGLGVGVKEILALAKEAQGPPWNQVRGHVVELLEVDLENAALLEVALGARAQLIVLDEGSPLVDFLSDGKCRLSGRVGFLAARRAPGRPIQMLRPSRRPGPLSPRAAKDSICRAGPESYAAPTASCDRPQASTTSPNDCWPTRGSWPRSTSPWRWRGPRPSRAGSSRTRENCWSRTARCMPVRCAAKRRSCPARANCAGSRTSWRGSITTSPRHRSSSNAWHAEVGRVCRNFSSFSSIWTCALIRLPSCEPLSAAKSSIWSASCAKRPMPTQTWNRRLRHLEELKPRWDAASKNRRRLEAVQHELQARIDAGAEQVIADEARLPGELQTLYAAEQRDLAKFEERLQNLHSARTRLDQERLQRDLHREEAERRFQMLAAKRDQIELEILNTNAVLHDLASQKEVLAADVAQLQQARDFARLRRGELSERELQVRHRLRDLKDRQHALDMQSTETRHQITSLEDRLAVMSSRSS